MLAPMLRCDPVSDQKIFLSYIIRQFRQLLCQDQFLRPWPLPRVAPLLPGAAPHVLAPLPEPVTGRYAPMLWYGLAESPWESQVLSVAEPPCC